eukprot:2382249-Pyramimonas_sp.AAC.1
MCIRDSSIRPRAAGRGRRGIFSTPRGVRGRGRRGTFSTPQGVYRAWSLSGVSIRPRGVGRGRRGIFSTPHR